MQSRATASNRRLRAFQPVIACRVIALLPAQYSTYAWGMDELQPLSKRGKNSFAGMGATIVDSLSTLWIMDMKEEFANATAWVQRDLHFPLTQVRCLPICGERVLLKQPSCAKHVDRRNRTALHTPLKTHRSMSISLLLSVEAGRKVSISCTSCLSQGVVCNCDVQEISLFETNIRVVGGLLSAYDLSGDNVFLGRAQELVELMLPAMGSDDVGTGMQLATESSMFS